MTDTKRWLTIEQIEIRVCDIVAEQLAIQRADVHPGLRIIEDLHCDSLDMVELIMSVEEAFDVTLPGDAPDSTYKVVFTRSPFRLCDLAELVYLRQAAPLSGKSRLWRRARFEPSHGHVPFTQLGGRIETVDWRSGRLFDLVETNKHGRTVFRRRTDGMQCVSVPGADAAIGSDAPAALEDERPLHRVQIDGFLIDQEPVSTTAYCRFLNSVGVIEDALLHEWFRLTPDDHRHDHVLLRHDAGQWSPLPGTERMPMMLVSWFGANAYALWANRRDWRAYRDDDGCLPTEAQWEYAARGSEPSTYPWGNDPASPDRMRYAQHEPGLTYAAEALPMASVNEDVGLSPFGLRHMAGNVWHWCRDWFDPGFYETAAASAPNPVNSQPTGIRSERGGSWVGPATLCRSSYRRGRIPTARGRCLGFRCVTVTEAAIKML